MRYSLMAALVAMGAVACGGGDGEFDFGDDGPPSNASLSRERPLPDDQQPLPDDQQPLPDDQRQPFNDGDPYEVSSSSSGADGDGGGRNACERALRKARDCGVTDQESGECTGEVACFAACVNDASCDEILDLADDFEGPAAECYSDCFVTFDEAQ